MSLRCDRCRQDFKDAQALAHHVRDSSAHHVCDTCTLDFSSPSYLVDHYLSSPSHNYCKTCSTHHATVRDLVRHIENIHHQCLVCGVSLATAAGLRLHYHGIHWLCLECRLVCESSAGLDEHQREAHWYCADCKRIFETEAGLKAHLQSSHTGTGTSVHCPGLKCNRAFKSGSALIQHLESGTCKSGANRREINRLAVELDTANLVTNPARLLAGASAARAPAPAITAAWATERSWNGRHYQCVVCRSEFDTLKRLNQHLQSPVHDQKVYRCPKDWKGCGHEFTTLSALCQHVEKGSCGVHQFNSTVQKYVGSLADGMRRLEF